MHSFPSFSSSPFILPAHSKVITPLVFPLAFSINASYVRREKVLEDLAHFKAAASALYWCHRDWTMNSNLRPEHADGVRRALSNIVDALLKYLTHRSRLNRDAKLRKVYRLLSRISKANTAVLHSNVPGCGPLVARLVHQMHLVQDSFEQLKNVREYLTPRSIRNFFKIFVSLLPLMLAPHFVYQAREAEEVNVWGAYYSTVLVTLIFGALQSVQDGLDDPFDGVGEDDVSLYELSLWPSVAMWTSSQEMLPVSGLPISKEEADQHDNVSTCTYRSDSDDEYTSEISRLCGGRALSPEEVNAMVQDYNACAEHGEHASAAAPTPRDYNSLVAAAVTKAVLHDGDSTAYDGSPTVHHSDAMTARGSAGFGLPELVPPPATDSGIRARGAVVELDGPNQAVTLDDAALAASGLNGSPATVATTAVSSELEPRLDPDSALETGRRSAPPAVSTRVGAGTAAAAASSPPGRRGKRSSLGNIVTTAGTPGSGLRSAANEEASIPPAGPLLSPQQSPPAREPSPSASCASEPRRLPMLSVSTEQGASLRRQHAVSASTLQPGQPLTHRSVSLAVKRESAPQRQHSASDTAKGEGEGDRRRTANSSRSPHARLASSTASAAARTRRGSQGSLGRMAAKLGWRHRDRDMDGVVRGSSSDDGASSRGSRDSGSKPSSHNTHTARHANGTQSESAAGDYPGGSERRRSSLVSSQSGKKRRKALTNSIHGGSGSTSQSQKQMEHARIQQAVDEARRSGQSELDMLQAMLPSRNAAAHGPLTAASSEVLQRSATSGAVPELEGHDTVYVGDATPPTEHAAFAPDNSLAALFDSMPVAGRPPPPPARLPSIVPSAARGSTARSSASPNRSEGRRDSVDAGDRHSGLLATPPVQNAPNDCELRGGREREEE